MNKHLARVGLALAFSLVATGVSVPSQAADSTVYRQGRYSVTKLSHPNDPVRSPDGIVDFNGEPDRAQSYSWSAVGYGDDIYVGTCYAAIYTTIRMIGMRTGMSMDVINAGLDALFNGTLMVDRAVPYVNRGVLVKINTRTSEVTLIDSPHAATNYRAALEYKGKLYFASSIPSLVEVDPANGDATKVVYSVPAPADRSISVGIRGLAEVNGKLVASMISDAGASLVASENPTDGPAAFTTIATQTDLFDYPAYRYTDSIFGGSIWDIVSFDGKMYVSIVTGRNGSRQPFALVRGDELADGSWTWTPLVGDPADGARYDFGLGAPRSGAANLAVFNDHLYIGGYNDPMIALPDALLNMKFVNLYDDLSAPVQLWKMDADEQFQMVAGEANAVFPEGPTGNMGSGFGYNTNQYVWRMTEYQGKFYLGTLDLSSLAYPLGQFANGDILRRTPEEWASQIEYLRVFIEALQNSGALAAPAGAPTPATVDPAIANVPADAQSRANAAAQAAQLKGKMETMAPGLAKKVEAGSAAEFAANAEQAGDLLAQLEELRALFEPIRALLPDDLRAQLDELFSAENIENLRAFVGVMYYLSQAERGFDLLVSSDGDNFEFITNDGFGDPYNHGLRVFATTDNGLGIGTANPFYGTQVWLLNDPSGKAPKAPKPPKEPKAPKPPKDKESKPKK